MGVAATNPQNAFTLDIHSDKNKVKLHLNRALIKKVLHDNRLNTTERRKARRQVSHVCPVYISDLLYSVYVTDFHQQAALTTIARRGQGKG